MKQRKRVALHLILAASSLAFCLALTEVALRLALPPIRYAKAPGPSSSYELITPEFRTRIRINSLGLRGGEMDPPKDGEYRILCLGDSFTFGVGVEENQAYPAVLQKLLESRGFRVRVINAIGGNNAGAGYRFLLKNGLSLRPDFVIVQIYIGNDFYDGLPAEPRDKSWPRRWLQIFKSESVALNFFWQRLIQFDFVDRLLFRLKARYNHRGLFLKTYPHLERCLAASEISSLRKINRLLERRGIDRMFLIIPSKDQLFMKQFLSGTRYEWRRPNRILRAFFKTKRLLFLDLLESYESIRDSTLRSFYFKRDEHWTAKGHEDSARRLSEHLRANHAGPFSGFY